MSKNLGIISYIVANNLTNNLVENKIDDNLFKFIEILKESEILSKEYLVIKNIENKYIESDLLASKYIDENISIFKDVKYVDYINEHKKLDGIFINENSVTDKYKLLFESIQNLIIETTIKKGVKSVDKIHESFENILLYIKNNKPELLEENVNTLIDDDMYDIFINSSVKIYNEKYSTLDEYEQKILKVINENNITEMDNLFQSLVTESKGKIHNLIESTDDEDVLNKLKLTEDKLNKFNFNSENFFNDIIKIYELYSYL